MVQPGPPDQSHGADWRGHHFEFRVEPYPVADRANDWASYYLVLQISD